MIAPETVSQTPMILEHNHSVVRQAIDCIEAGKYCALLGPRFSGKTAMLRYIQQKLSRNPTKLCMYVNLEEVETSTQATFFANLSQITARHTDDNIEHPLPISPTDVTSGSLFRNFLHDAAAWVKRDLVLIIDHLEAIPTDLLRALLTSLRATYMDWQLAEYHLKVIVASSLSLATHTVGESSPFRGIATTITTGDLAEHQSETLIAKQTESEGIEVSPTARRYLLRTAGGDAHLIREICRRCAQEVEKDSWRLLNQQVVEHVVGEFVRDAAANYYPLREAIRLIEEDPDLVRCIVLLLQNDTVSKRELPLPLSPDLDPLYLTGIVRNGPENSYQLRNEIYRQFLTQYFDTRRVRQLLTMAGRWDWALDYLEASIKAGNDANRADLLEAAINAMYASDDKERATSFMARGLLAIFGIREVQIWLISAERQALILAPGMDAPVDGTTLPRQEIFVNEDCLEAQAYREAYLLRAQEGDLLKRAVPLWVPGYKPIGVLTIDNHSDGDERTEQQDYDLELTSYLNQATRALQRLERTETLQDIVAVIGRSLDISTVLDQILDQMARVLPFDTASIQMLNASRTALNIIACKGFNEPASVKTLSFPLEDTYPNAKVWYDKKPLRYARAQILFPHFSDPKYHVTQVRGWLGIPLMVGDEAIGVITLDSFTPDIYTPEHESLAMIVAGQAALAIQRAQLYDREVQEKRLIQATAQMTGSVHDLEQTWRLILDGAMRLTGAEAGNISLVDEARGKVTNLIQIGFPENYPLTEHDIGGQSIQGWVAAKKQSVLVFNVKTDALWMDIYYAGLPDTLAELTVPILRNGLGGLVGIINLESPHEGAFTEADLHLLEDLAVHADLAVHNAQQYKALEKTKDYLLASEAVAWLGLFGADWQHSINQKIFSVMNYTDGLRRWLTEQQAPTDFTEAVFQALDGITRVVQSIRSVPFTSQVPTELPGKSNGQTIIDKELPSIVSRWCHGREDVQITFKPGCPGVGVKILPQWLRVAMEKLINNALKAMPEGGELTITTRLIQDIVHIMVKDTGRGIPDQARPYFLKQIVPRREGESGTGMGAMIARFVVLRHGGDLLLVNTCVGKGTELLMTLPVCRNEHIKSSEGGGQE